MSTSCQVERHELESPEQVRAHEQVGVGTGRPTGAVRIYHLVRLTVGRLL